MDSSNRPWPAEPSAKTSFAMDSSNRPWSAEPSAKTSFAMDSSNWPWSAEPSAKTSFAMDSSNRPWSAEPSAKTSFAMGSSNRPWSAEPSAKTSFAMDSSNRPWSAEPSAKTTKKKRCPKARFYVLKVSLLVVVSLDFPVFPWLPYICILACHRCSSPRIRCIYSGHASEMLGSVPTPSNLCDKWCYLNEQMRTFMFQICNKVVNGRHTIMLPTFSKCAHSHQFSDFNCTAQVR